VKIFTKEDCSLCEKAKQAILNFLRKENVNFEIEEIDICQDSTLYKKFKEQIPVIYINDRKAFKYFVNEEKLRRLINRLRPHENKISD
ncbi:MAG: glutaredoxin family protein, partial [Calditrichaeota bacterium]